MDFKELISVVGYAIEAVGVFVIVVGFVVSSISFLRHFARQSNDVTYRVYRRQLGHSIILGLEFLIAGDIIRTVVVADTLTNIAIY